MKKTLNELDLNGKVVLIREDFNVPMQNGQITSLKRIKAAIPTIKTVLNKGGKPVIFSHLGRVKTEEDKASKSLAPVAKELENELLAKVNFIPTTRGPELEQAIKDLKPGEVILVENTRFEDLNNKAESQNSEELGKYWASLGDVFINDAFATAHRAHASNVGIASNIAVSAVGLLLEKELKALEKVLTVPERPLIAIMGGAKVSDKILVIESLLKVADKIIIGGGMSYTFFKSQGISVGDSIVEDSQLELVKKYLDEYGDKIILPVDIAIADRFADIERKEIDIANGIPEGWMGLDIGPKTISKYQQALKGARTILWNGPVGVAEFQNYKYGTEAIAQIIGAKTNAYKIVGGGDSVAAIENLGLESDFDHISTGGGALIKALEGQELPGIAIINDSTKEILSPAPIKEDSFEVEIEKTQETKVKSTKDNLITKIKRFFGIF